MSQYKPPDVGAEAWDALLLVLLARSAHMRRVSARYSPLYTFKGPVGMALSEDRVGEAFLDQMREVSSYS